MVLSARNRGLHPTPGSSKRRPLESTREAINISHVYQLSHRFDSPWDQQVDADWAGLWMGERVRVVYVERKVDPSVAASLEAEGGGAATRGGRGWWQPAQRARHGNSGRRPHVFSLPPPPPQVPLGRVKCRPPIRGGSGWGSPQPSLAPGRSWRAPADLARGGSGPRETFQGPLFPLETRSSPGRSGGTHRPLQLMSFTKGRPAWARIEGLGSPNCPRRTSLSKSPKKRCLPP